MKLCVESDQIRKDKASSKSGMASKQYLFVVGFVSFEIVGPAIDDSNFLHVIGLFWGSRQPTIRWSTQNVIIRSLLTIATLDIVSFISGLLYLSSAFYPALLNFKFGENTNGNEAQLTINTKSSVWKKNNIFYKGPILYCEMTYTNVRLQFLYPVSSLISLKIVSLAVSFRSTWPKIFLLLLLVQFPGETSRIFDCPTSSGNSKLSIEQKIGATRVVDSDDCKGANNSLNTFNWLIRHHFPFLEFRKTFQNIFLGTKLRKYTLSWPNLSLYLVTL